jgi:hypothetical protein
MTTIFELDIRDGDIVKLTGPIDFVQGEDEIKKQPYDGPVEVALIHEELELIFLRVPGADAMLTTQKIDSRIFDSVIPRQQTSG